MNRAAMLSQLRHALTVAGTVAVTLGCTDSAHVGAIINNVMTITGGLLAAAAFIWSFHNARKNHQLKQWTEGLLCRKPEGCKEPS